MVDIKDKKGSSKDPISHILDLMNESGKKAVKSWNDSKDKEAQTLILKHWSVEVIKALFDSTSSSTWKAAASFKGNFYNACGKEEKDSKANYGDFK